jgi:ATP-dependent DNA ligase
MPDETVIDGEVVARDESGLPSFNALQNYGSSKTPIVYYLFDVLMIAGQDVMSEPLKWRWELLRTRALSKLDEPIREWTVLEASLPDLIRPVKNKGWRESCPSARIAVTSLGDAPARGRRCE